MSDAASLSPAAKRALLAQLLQQRAKALPTPACLIPLQPQGQKTPFFCIHPLGGSVLTYISLAPHLGTDRPLYGIQAVGLAGQIQPLTKVEDMAAHYLQAVRSVQPQGAYLFGGLSFGGIVALEMAQQLRQQQQEAALLVLMDTILPAPPQQPLDSHPFYQIAQLIETSGVENAHIWGEVARLMAEALHLFALDLPVSMIEMQQLDPAARVTALMELMRIANFLPPDIGIKDMGVYLQILKANLAASRHYTPQPYPHPTVLFKASAGHAADLEDPQIVWSKLIPQLETYSVPGNHMNLLKKEVVPPLAAKLKFCLDRTLI